ncbi:hypothetical protein [Piscinibacter terrae]|uniref:Uncharacterized protein n=1 Tax=Piscinibacter terrae TaxID=2496871 RepID=A0A3N7HXR0_9BURK|nr:hypothetical protein [Albitalea terrae]RQP26246.1 hypothetical protein DZC73_04220 [Albitalea terrae]
MLRTLSVVCSLPFLASLAVLMVNDLILKAAFPGWITGKLSDVAGIAMVGMLSTALAPSRRFLRFTAIGMGFLWWKSPASSPFIEWVNAQHWVEFGRVVDYTDLVALAILPWCDRLAREKTAEPMSWPLWRRLLAVPATGLTLLGLVGTSAIPTRQTYEIRDVSSSEAMRREDVVAAILAVAAKHSLACRQACDRPTEEQRLEGRGMWLIYRFVGPKAVSIEVSAFPGAIFVGSSGFQRADAVRQDIRAEFAARFKGLEYAEPLSPPR